MKSLLGTNVPQAAKGILYICDFDGDQIVATGEMFFKDKMTCLHYYAEIRNPESHMVAGDSHDELVRKHQGLVSRFNTPEHIEELRATIM